jgi:hypothetical protein
LQILDSTLAKHRARLKAIADTLGQNDAISDARAILADADAKVSQWQTRIRAFELEIKGIVDKSATAEKRLYSGVVTNTKEMADLQREIDSHNRHRVKLDDELAEAQLEAEQAEQIQKSARDSLRKIEAAFAESQTGLIAEKNTLEVEQATYTRRRKEAAAEVPPVALARYEDLRAKKRGIAVALLQNGSCAVCGVEQTSTIAQQVRSGQALVPCASCGRILAVT